LTAWGPQAPIFQAPIRRLLKRFSRDTTLMSLSGMNAGERASHFVGEAVRRYIENTPWSPAKENTLEALKQWMNGVFTADEWADVVKVMTFSEYLAEPPVPLRDVPF
jgi:hypothetical protein